MVKRRFPAADKDPETITLQSHETYKGFFQLTNPLCLDVESICWVHFFSFTA